MLSLDEALERLLAGVGSTAAEAVSLADAVGRAPLERRLVAASDVPPFTNSAMDGFALLAADGGDTRRIAGEARAGGPAAPRVGPGLAVRIMTGAPMPEGADAVVPLEEAREEGPTLHVDRAPQPGAHVRAAGHDVAAGATVVLADAPLGSASIGLLAAMGLGSIAVHRRPIVAILSTGDELQPAGQPLAAGQVHDANGPALAAAVLEAGGEPLLLEPAPDDAALVEDRLREGIGRADVLIASGGVSVGSHDHVRSAIERIGSLEFWRIAVQPGKPLAFGRIGERPVVGLPGNPVSALVTFELFVRPMLRRMLELPGDGRPRLRVRAAADLAKDPERRAFLRVRVERDGDGYHAVSAGGQASSQLLPLASANALLVVPEGVDRAEAGSTYEAILLGPVA